MGPKYAELGQKLKSSQISREEDEIGCISTYLCLCILAEQHNQDMTSTAIESNGVALAYAEVLLAHGSFICVGNEHNQLWDAGWVID